MSKVIEFRKKEEGGRMLSMEEAIDIAEKNLCIVINDLTMPPEEGFVVDKTALTEEAWRMVQVIKQLACQANLI
jgi:hypothetical protein